MLFWNWSDCSHRKKQTGERGRRNNEFTRTSGPQGLICPAYNFLHPLKKRKLFIALERNHERLSLLFTLWNCIFLRRGKRKQIPKPINFMICPEGLEAFWTLTKQSGGSKWGWKGNPRWKQKHTVPQGTKALRRICPTETDTLSAFACYLSA